MNSAKHAPKGFTLIELLVVISIIGVLSSVVLASLNTARAKGRDATRKQQMIQLRNSLEIYFAANGSYPSTGGAYFTSHVSGQPFGTSHNGGAWIPGLVASGAIGALPADPNPTASPLAVCTPDAWSRSYIYRSDGRNYKLIAHCSPEGPISSSDVFYDPLRPTHAFTLTSDSVATAGW